MRSQAFESVLIATGYMTADRLPAPGLVNAEDNPTFRLRPVLADRVGLEADAVFTAQDTPANIFKDAGKQEPSATDLQRWHEIAWNIGVAPLLWIVTPTEVRLYNCYASPRQQKSQRLESRPLATFSHDQPRQMELLNNMCGRFATETGAAVSMTKCNT